MQVQSTRSRIIVALGFANFACASAISHQYEMSPGRAFSGTSQRALVIPINETEEVPEGLEVGEETVFEELLAYLKSNGLEIETREIYEFRRAARRAAASAHDAVLTSESSSTAGEVDYTHIVPPLLASLESDAELVVLANMVIRTGESRGGRNVYWDGVKRKTSIGARSRLEGTESVASLFVAVFERDGTRVFSGYGGLDLIFRPNFREERYELIPDRLQDVEHIREGVCVAFYPFFGVEETCN